MGRKKDFNKLIKELKDSKTEEEILDYLIKLVKAFNLSEYNDVFQSNPYYKSLIPDVKPVVINDISKIRKDIVNEIEKIDKDLKKVKTEDSDKLKELKRDCISLIYEIDEREKEINKLN